MRVVVAQFAFHLFVGSPAVSDKLFRLVEDVGRGYAFSLFVDAILGDEQKRLRLNVVLVEEMHVFNGIVVGDEFPHLLHFPLQFLVEIPVLFVTDFFRASDGGTHGEIIDDEGLVREDFHEVVILPEREGLLDFFARRFEHLGHGEYVKIGVGILAEV